MADPFSVAGSAVGVVSLGISVTQALLQYYNSVKDLADDTASTKESLSLLQNSLILVKPWVSSDLIKPAASTQLASTVSACESSLSKLQKKWEKISTIQHPSSSPSSAIRKQTLKLSYPFRESTLAKLRETVSDFQDQLNTVLAILNIDTAQESRRQLDVLVDAKVADERERILGWLSTANYAAQHRDLFKIHEPGTGEWFLQSETFQSWQSNREPLLFLPGIPGAGKTVLACTIIDCIQKQDSSGGSALAMIFCSYKNALHDPVESHFTSILEQLSRQSDHLPEVVRHSYQKHRRRNTKPDLSELLEALRVVCESFQKVVVVVDALDEASGDRSTRSKLTKHLIDFQKTTRCQLLMTSRYHQEITQCFAKSQTCAISANAEDISKYVRARIEHLPKFMQSDQSLQNGIVDRVQEMNDGMFLVARLFIDTLQDSTSKKDVKQALRDIPKGPNVLATLYHDALQRINGQAFHSRALALKVLHWLVYAARPLYTEELQCALAVQDEEDFDPDGVPDLDLTMSVCAGLVTYDTESDEVRFVHHTTREFFNEQRETLLAEGRTYIVETCLSYLSYHSICRLIDDERFPYWGQPRWSDRDNHLLDYVASYFVSHARYAEIDASGTHEDSLAARLTAALTDPRKLHSIAFHLDDLWPLQSKYSRSQLAKSVHPLHIAALIGSCKVSKTLLNQSQDPMQVDILTRNPLMWSKDEKFIEWLISRLPALDETTAQSYARIYVGKLMKPQPGYDEHTLGQQILSKLSISANKLPTDFLAPSLKIAAAVGDAKMVRLLVKHARDYADGASLNTSALCTAVVNAHEDVVAALVPSVAEIDVPADVPDAWSIWDDVGLRWRPTPGHERHFKAGRNMSAIHYASFKGLAQITALLLQHGANPNLPTPRTANALHAAVDGKEDLETIKVLLDHGIDDCRPAFYMLVLRADVEKALAILLHPNTLATLNSQARVDIMRDCLPNIGQRPPSWETTNETWDSRSILNATKLAGMQPVSLDQILRRLVEATATDQLDACDGFDEVLRDLIVHGLSDTIHYLVSSGIDTNRINKVEAFRKAVIRTKRAIEKDWTRTCDAISAIIKRSTSRWMEQDWDHWSLLRLSADDEPALIKLVTIVGMPPCITDSGRWPGNNSWDGSQPRFGHETPWELAFLQLLLYWWFPADKEEAARFLGSRIARAVQSGKTGSVACLVDYAQENFADVIDIIAEAMADEGFNEMPKTWPRTYHKVDWAATTSGREQKIMPVEKPPRTGADATQRASDEVDDAYHRLQTLSSQHRATSALPRASSREASTEEQHNDNVDVM